MTDGPTDVASDLAPVFGTCPTHWDSRSKGMGSHRVVGRTELLHRGRANHLICHGWGSDSRGRGQQLGIFSPAFGHLMSNPISTEKGIFSVLFKWFASLNKKSARFSLLAIGEPVQSRKEHKPICAVVLLSQHLLHSDVHYILNCHNTT